MEIHLEYFHLCIQRWFANKFGVPTEVQLQAWPSIIKEPYTLIAAPTGSGKTLAAFLIAINELVKTGLKETLPQEMQVVYVSPLKALTNDIEKNLQEPLQGITAELEQEGLPLIKIKTAVRTGDTSASERASMVKSPPHILVTTPESLYLLLTSENGRKMLSTVKTVIVDEIHALADDKRGSHLSLSLERLEGIVSHPLKRIGLSATQKPIEKVASFLMGNRPNATCKIIDSMHHREYDLDLVLPYSPLSSVMSNEVWTEIHQKLVALIKEHRTTLIFVNTRRLSERLTHNLHEYLGDNMITTHHGSMSRKHREEAEQKLKNGELKAMVATASLELGIDIGSVDLVVQIASPRRISTFVQRLGRSKHYVNGIPKGRLIPLTLDDLLECTALLDSVKKNELDELQIPEKPIDVLAQQIVAELSCRDYNYYELFNFIKKAYPYRDLSEKEYDELIETLAKGYTTRRGKTGTYIFFDRVNFQLKARKAARLTALINGGVIPDSFDYDVILEPGNTFIGTVNEDFAVESLPGDIFQLGNSSWKITKIENGKVRVEDAHGQPPGMPFWLGEAPGRSNELSFSVSRLIKDIGKNIDGKNVQKANDYLKGYLRLPEEANEQLVNYLAMTKAALGELPNDETVIMERFFDEAGDMHLVIHSVFGMRVNKAWGLALRKRFCRKFNFELQAAANENSIILSLGATHSFPLDEVFEYLNPQTVRDVLIQAMLDSPIFEVRWRWNATTALVLNRRKGGKKVPAQIQRMQSEDLIALIFPDQLACFENLQGAREIPDHPLVNQTIYDCLHEAMDIDKLEEILTDIRAERIKVLSVDLKQPSPMAQEVLTAMPYAFLDDAPLEERRVRAIYSRRWSSIEEASEMAQLDSQAIEQVKDEVWPMVRSANELYEALMMSGFLTEKEIQERENIESWKVFLEELKNAGRATIMILPQNDNKLWIAVERLPEMHKIMPEGKLIYELLIPENILKAFEKVKDPLVEILRNRMEVTGPATVNELLSSLPVGTSEINRALLSLENEGFIFRGHFNPGVKEEEWCERRLLRRIHRYTLDKLRSAIQPVPPSVFMNFLFDWHKLLPAQKLEGTSALRQVMDQLEGFEAQSVSWEGDILPSRIKNYSYTDLDFLLMTGEYIWGRFKNSKGEVVSSVPIRTTPITFIKRENLKFYQTENQEDITVSLSLYAKNLYHLLKTFGAQFFYQLEERSRLLKTQVEAALTELISLGLITSDSFTGLRTLLIPDKYFTSKRHTNKVTFNLQQAGRWWIITSQAHEDGDPKLQEEYLNSLANMMLKRYGVVFRKLAEKEKLLFCWYDLLKIYRKMEAQGVIRGGRFIDGFGGEQFALPEAVVALREQRKTREEGELLVSVSASDPLNLTGFITPGKRVTAFYGNRILYKDGTPVAIKEGKDIVYVNEEDEETKWKLRQPLIQREVQPELRPYLVY